MQRQCLDCDAAFEASNLIPKNQAESKVDGKKLAAIEIEATRKCHRCEAGEGVCLCSIDRPSCSMALNASLKSVQPFPLYLRESELAIGLDQFRYSTGLLSHVIFGALGASSVLNFLVR